MQLSKQEFSKLSKKDKQMLMAPRKKTQQQKPRPKQQARRNGPGNGGKQASVAAAYSTTMMGKAPMVKASRDSCNIKHRELIGRVTGSVGFANAFSFALNPGLAATFPWLSIMAQGWEEYQFKKLQFLFRTSTGSTTPGTLIMAPDYDAADAAPLTENVVCAYQGAIADAPWKDMTGSVNASRMSGALGRRRYLRNAPLAANLDIKTYDVGNYFICTVDGTAVPWGKVWVEYDVDFFVPQLPPNGAVQLLGGKIVANNTITAANPLGIAPAVDPQAVGISANATSILTFANPGLYLLNMRSGGVAVLTQTATALTDCVVSVGSATVIDAGGAAMSTIWTVLVTGLNATVQIATTATTSVTSGTVWAALAPANSFT